MNKLVFIITFAFVSLQIFIPKIYLFGIPIYFFTILFIVLLFLIIASNAKINNHIILNSYIFYMIYLALTTLISGIVHNFPIWNILLYDFKYLLPLLLLPLISRYHYIFNSHFLELVYRSQIVFCGVVFFYVSWNMALTPLNIAELSGGYSQTHRFIGYTGYVFSDGSINRLGNTSVAMGVYVSLIWFIAFFKYLRKPNLIKLIVLIILFFCLLYTYSRSGLICLSVGLISYIALNFRKKNVLMFLFITLSSVSILVLQIGIENILKFSGSIGKLFVYFSLENEGIIQFTRLIIWQSGLDALANNPLALLFGVGHGESLVEHITGIAFYESLFFQTLIEGGVIGLTLLLIHFWAVGLILYKVRINSMDSDFFEFVQAIFYFFPGFLLANLVGGNLWQTDFLAPIFYCIVGVSIVEARKIKCSEGNIQYIKN